jgi:hypothetical protein
MSLQLNSSKRPALSAEDFSAPDFPLVLIRKRWPHLRIIAGDCRPLTEDDNGKPKIPAP